MSTASSAQFAQAYPWLRPATAALLALADDTPDSAVLRDDPGLVLHVLRYSRPTPDPMTFGLDEATLCQPGLCETATKLLETQADGHRDRGAEIVGQSVAHVAELLATETQYCSPDAAWAVGLLAPLGRYLGDTDNPMSLSRRVLARWRMPLWVQVALGYLDLPIHEANGLGGHRGVNRILRAAIRATAVESFSDLRREPDDALDSLALKFAENLPTFREVPHDPEPALLPRLLKATAVARGRTAQTWMVPLEDRLDSLVAQLAEARNDFDHQLRDAKLDALAEFAAGASHEINNPLAVISGNAQWLKTREADPEKAQHLQTILRQTQRIHDLLTGTRQFSCPTPAKSGVHTVESIFNRVVKDFAVEAETLGVQLEIVDATDGSLHADAEQVRTAMGHLVRNGLQAAGRGGTVKLSSTVLHDGVAIRVEDSGPGPDAESQEHLFDPFYSGRSAGRGRGLGLSIAWALAKNNGGEVRWAGPDPSGTRFTLTLRRAIPQQDAPTRKVA